MNSALLAKLAWRVLTAPDSLLSKIINTKYGRKGYIGRSRSKISQGLKAGFKNLEGKIMWKIGSVQKVKLGVVGAQVNPRYQHLLHLLSLLLQIKQGIDGMQTKSRKCFTHHTPRKFLTFQAHLQQERTL